MLPETRRRLASALIIANLVGQLLILITGGAVRLTGSGLGCTTWPHCVPGSFTPVAHQNMGIHPYIEYGNRVVGLLLGLVAVALFFAVRSVRPRRSTGFLWLAAVPPIGVAWQGFLGGITVWVKLNPAIVGSHFLFSAALIWASTLLWWRWRNGDAPTRTVGTPLLRGLGWALAGLTAVIVVLGMIVTGSGPHSGDESVGYRFAVDPLAFTRAHSTSVWVFVAVLIAFIVVAVRAHKADGGLSVTLNRAAWVVGTVVVQGGIGYYQYFNGLPEVAVALHMLGSGVLIVTVTLLIMSLRPRPVAAPTGTPQDAVAASV